MLSMWYLFAAPSQLSTLTPVTGKALNNVKVKKIFGRENYPIAEGFPSGLTHLQVRYTHRVISIEKLETFLSTSIQF